MKKLLSFAVALTASAMGYMAQAQLTNQDLQLGDTVVDESGRQWLVGENLIVNPSFDEITEDGTIKNWYTANGYATMKSTDFGGNFIWHETGGFDGGAYIQANKHTGAAGEGSIAARWTLEQNAKYYLTFWLKQNSENNPYIPIISLTSQVSANGGENEFGETGKTLLGKNGTDGSGTTYGCANYSADGWAQTSLFFDSEEYTYLQYNARWLKENAIQACFDGFYLARLYDAETTSQDLLAELVLQGAINQAYTLLDKFEAKEWTGVYGELEEQIWNAEGVLGTDVDAMKQATEDIRKEITEFELVYDAGESLESLVLKAENIVATTMYPGLDDLATAIGTAQSTLFEGSSEDVLNGVAVLDKAIDDYYYSQTYSENSPADYTFLVSTPQFCVEAAEPTVVDGVFTYPNVANYEDGKSNSDNSSEGWYRGSFTDGDQRLNYVQQRMCWNAWATSFDEVSINQDIEGIPNGYYTVSADLITQAGCVTDQRVYAKSSLDEAESVSMNADNVYWMVEAPNAGTWETLTSAKVMVSDGKITIGAKGSGDTEHLPTEFGGTNDDHRRGWFCVTNFKLNYYGPLSEEDTKAAFEKRIAELQAQCDTMTFKGDKAAYQDSINKYKNASSLDEMNEALVALAAAQTTASASISKQVSVKAGITAALTDSIDNGAYEGDYLTMATKFRDCMLAEINAEDATYTEMDSIVQILYSFRDSYVPTLVEARALVVTDSEAKAVLDKNINDQVTDFTTMEALPLQTKIEKYVADLETAIAECEAFNLYKTGTKDYTSMIVNADIEDSSTTYATGWIVNKGAGNNFTGSSQQVDGNTSGRYLDSYNSTSGKLNYTAYQTINYIPNGTYKLEAMTRTSAEAGAYLYAMADEDSTTTKLSLIELETMNITELGGPSNSAGEDSIGVVMDTYGSIFADLYKRTDGGKVTTDAEADTLNAHDGKGYGWHYTSLEIEVKNHVLTIGVTTDSTFTEKYGGEPFTGTWFSADNFTLKMIAEGDNSDWNPTTGITVPGEAVENKLEIKVVDGTIVSNGEIYSLSGVRVASGSKVPAGVYIVRLGDQSKKVLVK